MSSFLFLDISSIFIKFCPCVTTEISLRILFPEFLENFFSSCEFVFKKDRISFQKLRNEYLLNYEIELISKRNIREFYRNLFIILFLNFYKNLEKL